MPKLEKENSSVRSGEKPWLKRKFRDGKLFIMPIDYIYEHIGLFQKDRLGPNADSWTVSKEYLINELLDSGMSSDEIYPIRISLHPLREELSITDGITRLRVYKRRGMLEVRVKMYHG